MKPFDPNHPRCIFPIFGQAVDGAMRTKGFTNTALAAKLSIDHTAVAGYRRGFSRPADPARVSLMEKLLGITLDLSEPRPSERKSAVMVPPPHPALGHLAAAALALGFKATFVPVGAP